MAKITNDKKNYDKVFKESILLFKDKTLAFAGLDLAAITEPLNPEHIEVTAKETHRDLLFKLEDGSGLHLEWQAKIEKDDLLRFLSYNVDSTRRYKTPFITVVFTKKAQRVTTYKNKSVKFFPKVINLGERDGDALLADIKSKLAAGAPVNELEFVYLPLYNSSSKTVAQRLEEVFELAPQVAKNKEQSQKLMLLASLLTDKFVSETEQRKIWEGIKMLAEDSFIIKFAREDGKAEGITEEKRRLALKLLKRGDDVTSIIELVGLTKAELKELNKPKKQKEQTRQKKQQIQA